MTVEANPETVTPGARARCCAAGGVTPGLARRAELPAAAARVARAAARRRTTSGAPFYHLRDAGFDNISLDLIYGIPGQSAADLERDLAEALALGPEHLSCYELEAKPGTRFTHAHGDELARQAEAMEGYFELVVETLTGAGYRWYETANFCRAPERAAGATCARSTTSPTGSARDYLGLGIGAVSTLDGERWRNTPRLGGYVAALARGRAAAARARGARRADVAPSERVMLGLRLDEPLAARRRERRARPDARSSGSERLGLAARRPRRTALR